MPRVISRSARETFDGCPRRGYLSYDYAGTGLDSPIPNQNLVIGNADHKGLETFFRIPFLPEAERPEDPLEAGVSAAVAEFDRLSARHYEVYEDDPKVMSELQENRVLVEALAYGWLSRRAEWFYSRYEVLHVEKELRTPLSPDVILASRLDLLVRDKLTGLVWSWNHKTSGSGQESVEKTYKFSTQMWAEALAAEWDIKEPVQGTILSVLLKGVRRSGTYSNALMYYFEKNGVRRPDYVRGWTKVRADQGIGLRAWIDSLDSETIDKYFFLCEPVLKDNAVVEERIAGWVHREHEIMHVLESGSEQDKLLHFRPEEGPRCDWCIFKAPCYLRTTVEEMVANGQLQPRVDHHSDGPLPTPADATIQAVTKEIK